jgi:hypothetical protein
MSAALAKRLLLTVVVVAVVVVVVVGPFAANIMLAPLIAITTTPTATAISILIFFDIL